MPVRALSDMAEWRKRSRTIASMGAFAYAQLPVRSAIDPSRQLRH
jgi:hypothetical protein